MRDTAGNVEAARQAARELARAELGKVAQPDKVDRLVHQRAAALAVADVETTEIVDVLAHCELVKHRHLLRHHANAALKGVAGGRHGLAEQLDGTFVVGEQLQDTVDGRGFARAVGAQQAKDLAGQGDSLDPAGGDALRIDRESLAELMRDDAALQGGR